MSRETVYNKIFTEEDWNIVNKNNKILLDDFVDYKKSSNKSPDTIIQYYNALRIFFIWNLNNNDNKFYIDLKKREVIRFFNYVISDLKASSNRMAFIRSTLSSFSNFIEMILDDEYPSFRNIIKATEPVTKETVREKTILEEEELKECLQKLVVDKKYQEACYLALGMCSGSRKSELLRFKLSYFNEENIVFGCMFKTPEKIKTKGRSANGKMLHKYTFMNPFKEYLDLWVKERERLNIDSEFLFVRKTTSGYEQALVSTANSWVNTIEKVLGKDFYSHSLRHYFVTSLKKKSLPDDVVVEIVGWADSSLIKTYNDIDMSETIGQYFDENGIKDNIKVGKIND